MAFVCRCGQINYTDRPTNLASRSSTATRRSEPAGNKIECRSDERVEEAACSIGARLGYVGRLRCRFSASTVMIVVMGNLTGLLRCCRLLSGKNLRCRGSLGLSSSLAGRQRLLTISRRRRRLLNVSRRRSGHCSDAH
jgi:hypothetical protein